MIADRDDSWRAQEENARVTKRRKAKEEPLGYSNPLGGDHYDEIVAGHVNGEVRHSWLRSIHGVVGGNGYEVVSNGELSNAIKSLTRQLTQTKRRLWPAAERCAQIHGTSPEREFSEARRICNPMEPLGEGRKGGLNQMFMNRSAIKLANIDAILNCTLTSANEKNFLFVDIAGAPGGFSEYLIKRCQGTRTAGSCRGYGMSLVGSNEHGNGTPWRMAQMSERTGGFEASYHVSGGADGSGDLYNWANVVGLARGIEYDLHFAKLRPQKVHLVVADGGFDAQRDSECQEELSQKLVLCEIAAALYLLQTGGLFVIKMFGFRTSSVRTAMRDLYDYFDQVVVLKPISSRPASAERYVVCTGFRGAREFDGTQWMNSVILRRESKQDRIRYSSLDKMLDEFDRDLLQLNLKTCFGILSTLDRKSATQNLSSMQDDETSWGSHLPTLNVDMYRHAWRLN